MAGWPQTPDTLFVRVAGLGRCGDVRDVVLHVLPNGGLTLNEQLQKRKELGRRLDAIYETRWSKHVYVASDPNVAFSDVLEVIRIAAKHVNYVVVVTASVLKQATYRGNGTCLAPNLPSGYPSH
jgi:hypothetical protein